MKHLDTWTVIYIHSGILCDVHTCLSAAEAGDKYAEIMKEQGTAIEHMGWRCPALYSKHIDETPIKIDDHHYVLADANDVLEVYQQRLAPHKALSSDERWLEIVSAIWNVAEDTGYIDAHLSERVEVFRSEVAKAEEEQICLSLEKADLDHLNLE